MIFSMVKHEERKAVERIKDVLYSGSVVKTKI